ncbi:MAG: hypothetical protein V4555_07020 [Acidobacteriota bacterium]
MNKPEHLSLALVAFLALTLVVNAVNVRCIRKPHGDRTAFSLQCKAGGHSIAIEYSSRQAE